MPNFITSRKLWFGLGGTALFLGLFFWRTDLSELTDALGDATYWWMIPAVAIWFVSAAVRSLRWHYLLRHIAGLGTVTLYPILVIGYMANNLLPLRTGELVRTYILGERHGVSKMAALGTVAVERLFDGVVLVSFLLLAGAFLGLSGELEVLLVAIKADSGLHRAVSASRIFAVHIVGKSQKELAMAFFRGAEPAANTLNGYVVETGQTGVPLLVAPPAWFECRVVNEVRGGDHTIFVGEVVDAGVRSEEEALTLRDTGFAYGG